MARRTYALLAASVVVCATAWLTAQSPTRAPIDPRPAFAEPSLSPDGNTVTFVSGGDIWDAPIAGGDARLLVSHPATESRPIYSPDGSRLAFVSTRTGGGDVYLLTLATGDLKRLTVDDGLDQLDGWSRDGKWVYFSSTSHDISSMNDVYRVSADGGTPMPVSADRYANEFFSAPSPDGQTLAITARGVASGQWWRRGHSHLDESGLWLLKNMDAHTYERLSADGAKELWPMWAPDGRALFYVSDRSGAQNVWTRPLDAAPRMVTNFRDGRVLWPSIARDGRTIVFERGFQIWKLDVAGGKAAAIPIARRGAPAGPAVDHLTLSNQLRELALSPDGKKVAFIVRGEVFAASAKDGGDAARVSTTAADESQVVWSPDSRRLAYVSDREGPHHVYVYDFASGAETPLTRGARDDRWPRFSPDGKSLAFERDQQDLVVLDLDSKQERTLVKGKLADTLSSGRPFVWSPDGKWLAYFVDGTRGFSNIAVVPSAGGEARPISFLANSFGGTVSWSPDGAFVLFDSGQRTEDGQIARVDLTPRTPVFRENQFRDLFQEETPRRPAPAPPAADKPDTPKPAAPGDRAPDAKPAISTDIAFDGIRRRLTLLPIGLDAGQPVLSPDGKTVLFIAGAAGQQNLYTYSIDELARERPVARQITSTAGAKADPQFTADGKDIYYLDDGRIQTLTLERREPKTIAVAAEMDVDFAREKLEVFQQAWSYLHDNFFDPEFNGVDWVATRAQYEPLVAGARTMDEVRRIGSLMIGELNASHLGFNGPAGGSAPSVGKLGLSFDRGEYETSGRLRVTSVLDLGPAALTRAIKPGDYLVSVDGAAISARTNLDELLDHKINRRVPLRVSSSPDARDPREVVVKPINQATEKGLLYRQWVEERRAYVDKASGGKLGYVHMFDMSANALSQLSIDLDADNHARQGVVIDVRNNNGGFVNVYAIDVLARRGYLTMTQRGRDAAPARTVLGQRALERPTVLVTNMHSLSDAEDFTEGYRSLGLGKVVGEPTAGWIIYTWNQTLIDGSTIRLPRMRVTAADGSAMEMHPRPVDVRVDYQVGESYAGRDSQLDAAVKELLKQLSTKRTDQ